MLLSPASARGIADLCTGLFVFLPIVGCFLLLAVCGCDEERVADGDAERVDSHDAKALTAAPAKTNSASTSAARARDKGAYCGAVRASETVRQHLSHCKATPSAALPAHPP